ncbi:MAG: YigZ family protein [Alistipes sp.]|nr:YigZ family protein [Candidatus Alistipes equi]
MDAQKDSFLSIAAPVESVLRERSSKFLSFAYPVKSEEDVKVRLQELKKRYFDATHHCFAYRLGVLATQFRSSDDGEPGGTAGKPILGQLISRDLTDTLVVVVRYFGGTKLGTSGLIQTYRASASDVLQKAQIKTYTVNDIISFTFLYERLNDVMRILKEMQLQTCEQQYGTTCLFRTSVRRGRSEELKNRLGKVLSLTFL